MVEGAFAKPDREDADSGGDGECGKVLEMKASCVICDGDTLYICGEPEFVGRFPLRQDITVLGPDCPRGCLEVKDERERDDGATQMLRECR